MNKTLQKTIWREIRHTLGRYLAIFAIIALGVGFFCGVKVSQDAMVKTGDIFTKEHHLFDYRLISTLGFTQEDVDAIKEKEGISMVEGGVELDVLCATNATLTEEEVDAGQEADQVMRIHSLTNDVNTLSILAGRLPEKENECVVDSNLFDESDLGKELKITSSNEKDTLEKFKYDSYTIVGVADSPYYLNMQRGTTSIGNGKVAGFCYVPKESLDMDYYTEIFVTLENMGDLYSQEYKDKIDATENTMKEITQERADIRYEKIVSDAQSELADGQKEFDDAKATYEKEKNDAESQLADSKKQLENRQKELQDAEKKLQDSSATLEEKEKELDSAQSQITSAKATLAQKKTELQQTKQATLAQLDSEKQKLSAVLEQVKAQLEQIAGLGLPEEEELLAQKAQLEAGLSQLEQERESALAQFAAAEQEIAQQEAYLKSQQQQIDSGRQQVEQGKKELAQGQKDLEDGKEKLSQGEKQYSEAEQEANEQFAKAERELDDAQKELDDAQKEIDDIEKPTTYVMDRTTNIGVSCFENDTNIISGIAQVFPIFFILVAALVCITTMTRMVDEQRTQIGVLKALGYSTSAIMGKYMFYSGSAAFLGCIFGFCAGSVLFPKVVWIAYNTMYRFSDIYIVWDIPMGIMALIVSMAGSLGATWFACGKELLEVPAQLIRPQSPKGGKRIFLERIPFLWSRMKFLHKVSMRNIFRYKRRFFMMVIGISGCTALLLTGFGVRDSIQNVVNYQYDEITLYDYAVTFQDPMTQEMMDAFQKENDNVIKDIKFVYEGSMDLQLSDGVKSLYFVAADGTDFNKYIDFHQGEEKIPYPGKGEAVINNNIANLYNIKVGDTITLQDSDHNTICLKVSGVFDNYVYNYVYTSLETYEELMGKPAEIKTAYINGSRANNQHAIAAQMMEDDNVANVTVNEDTRDMINNMLSSLNVIVVVLIFCAGALAFIVLYNLTNINILERVREIATIKVLGFYPNETASYVFRENLLLTAIGTLVGLGLGKALHAFVMYQVQVDMMCFDVRIVPLSYLFSVVLTFVFAWIVNRFMRIKLKKINMAESLKSIE